MDVGRGLSMKYGVFSFTRCVKGVLDAKMVFPEKDNPARGWDEGIKGIL
jgi:hypothetical protein